MIGAAQVDTCTEDLLKKSIKAAEQRGIPMQVHASQSVFEFREIVKRHNMTPFEWLDSLGALGPHTIIGHGLNVDRHPWINFHTQYTAITTSPGSPGPARRWRTAPRVRAVGAT